MDYILDSINYFQSDRIALIVGCILASNGSRVVNIFQCSYFNIFCDPVMKFSPLKNIIVYSIKKLFYANHKLESLKHFQLSWIWFTLWFCKKSYGIRTEKKFVEELFTHLKICQITFDDITLKRTMIKNFGFQWLIEEQRTLI